MLKKILSVILFLFIVFRVGSLVYKSLNNYRADYWNRYPSLKGVYGESQYRMKAWKYWIPDETAYSYAAGAYIQGADPIIVESTQPPLGKYLIGLSILLTQSENTIVTVFFVLLTVGIYLLSMQVSGSVVVSLIVVLFSSFERLFTDQIFVTPLLDIFHITFLVYGIAGVSYALAKRRPVFLLLSYGCFGAALMIKVWLIGAVFVIPVTIYVLVRAGKYYPYVIGGFAVMLVITLLSYTRMFLDGYNIIQVLLVQKWLYWYQNGKRTGLFTIWPLIFMNKWYVWWGGMPVIQDQSWVISWPVSIGIGLLGSIATLTRSIKKSHPARYLTALSIIAYALFISMGQASARYLLPLLPFCYVMGGWLLFSLSKKLPAVRSIV
jgi:hypothetical protein